MQTFEFDVDVMDPGNKVRISHDPGSMDGPVEITHGGRGLSVPKRALFEFVAEESRKALVDQFAAELGELSPDALLALAAQDGLEKSLGL